MIERPPDAPVLVPPPLTDQDAAWVRRVRARREAIESAWDRPDRPEDEGAGPAAHPAAVSSVRLPARRWRVWLALVMIGALSVAGSIAWSAAGCDARWESVPHRWTVLGGCQVQTPGRQWVPDANWRFFP